MKRAGHPRPFGKAEEGVARGCSATEDNEAGRDAGARELGDLPIRAISKNTVTAEIAVVGGRGKTGRSVIDAVRARGVSARPLGRAELRDAVAELRGVTAVYLIAPNMHADEPTYVRNILAAAREAGVRRIVYHSVASPHLPEMPHHLGKAEAEREVRASGAEWSILQPCAYIQNFVTQLSGTRPGLVVAYDPDRRFGLVDLADVAEVAALALLGPTPGQPAADSHSLIGATVELGGPAQVSVHDVALAAEGVLGHEVPVRRIDSQAWATGAGARLDARERNWVVAMFDHYDRHGLPCGAVATRALLGREPRSVADVLRRHFA